MAARADPGPSRWVERWSGVLFASVGVVAVLTVPVWAPVYAIAVYRSRWRARRFRERTARLPNVNLAIEGEGLVLTNGADGHVETIAFSDLAAGSWCELDRDGPFAAANTPPAHILELWLLDGSSRIVWTESDEWKGLDWSEALLARRLLPRHPQDGGRTHAGYWGVFVLATLVAWIVVALLIKEALW